MTLKGLFDPIYLEAAEAEYDFILKSGIAVSYFMEADYPDYLQHCLDGPILLFQKGNIDIKSKKIISVVGTRNITSYGTAFCQTFIEEIAPLNPVIVSGFAYGVDITIQRAAMERGLADHWLFGPWTQPKSTLRPTKNMLQKLKEMEAF